MQKTPCTRAMLASTTLGTTQSPSVRLSHEGRRQRALATHQVSEGRFLTSVFNIDIQPPCALSSIVLLSDLSRSACREGIDHGKTHQKRTSNGKSSTVHVDAPATSCSSANSARRMGIQLDSRCLASRYTAEGVAVRSPVRDETFYDRANNVHFKSYRHFR